MVKKTYPLIKCLKDVLWSYGYSVDDIEEGLIRLNKHDDIQLELENGNRIVHVVAAFMSSAGYDRHTEDFDIADVRDSDIKLLTDFVYESVLDIEPSAARNWVIKTIEYISSPQYWKYARIMYILDGVTHLPNDVIPPEVLAEALAEARNIHIGELMDGAILKVTRRAE